MGISHRTYVGSFWEEIGKAQFDFAVEMGLKPHHKFLDIGCGCGRGGRLFIPYLNEGNYYGIDHLQELIDAGLKYEIKQRRDAHFIVNENFDFKEFGNIKFDFVLAKSVFTHLTKDKIGQCLSNLKGYVDKDGIFYATIFVGNSGHNLKESNDVIKFLYSIDEIRESADGWKVEVLPEELQMSQYEPRSKQTMLKFYLK